MTLPQWNFHFLPIMLVPCCVIINLFEAFIMQLAFQFSDDAKILVYSIESM